MKKFLLFSLTAFLVISAKAQVSEADALLARHLITKNAAAIGLSENDINNTVVSATYLSSEGIRMVYLYQSYKNIPVYNQMHVLAFKNEKPVSITGGRIKAFNKLVNNPEGIPVLTAGDAVLSAIADAGIAANRIIG